VFDNPRGLRVNEPHDVAASGIDRTSPNVQILSPVHYQFLEAKISEIH